MIKYMKVLLCHCLAVFSALVPAQAELIRFKGSDVLGAKLIPQLCELYKKQHPDLVFEIAAEGSSSGFTALLEGATDIGTSDREIKPEEAQAFAKRGMELSRWNAANDMVVIAVHAKNPIGNLTKKQIEAIFTGDVTNWSDVGGPSAPISVYTRNTASGSYKDFQRLAMSGRPYAGKSVKMLGSNTPQQSVSRDEHGISYIGLAYARASGIKALKIDGQAATFQNVHTYPYVRHLYYFAPKSSSGTVTGFLDWATHSAEARMLISKVGFVPSE
jgi:phosphate transport system substrate-binding protein